MPAPSRRGRAPAAVAATRDAVRVWGCTVLAVIVLSPPLSLLQSGCLCSSHTLPPPAVSAPPRIEPVERPGREESSRHALSCHRLPYPYWSSKQWEGEHGGSEAEKLWGDAAGRSLPAHTAKPPGRHDPLPSRRDARRRLRAHRRGGEHWLGRRNQGRGRDAPVVLLESGGKSGALSAD